MKKVLTCQVLVVFLLVCVSLSQTVEAHPALTGDNGTSAEVGVACLDNSQCVPGFYCAKLPGRCDSAGVCEPRPQACITLYDPVCGCDCMTYGNACDAARAGVSVAYSGECTQFLRCDVNKDGYCDIVDVMLVLRTALGMDTQMVDADINGDGWADISDVILTLRIALGLDSLKECTG